MSEIKPCPLCVSAPKDDPYDVARRLLARLAYAGGCRLETHRDIIELDPALSKVKASVAIDAMTTFASDACASVQRERDELREEVERLRKMVRPQWFYYGDDCSSDQCRDSVHECIDDDFLWDNTAEGSHVLEISTATNLPTIWAAVHFFTEEEKDARQDDEEYEVTEFASKAEAEAFLARYEAGK